MGGDVTLNDAWGSVIALMAAVLMAWGSPGWDNQNHVATGPNQHSDDSGNGGNGCSGRGEEKNAKKNLIFIYHVTYREKLYRVNLPYVYNTYKVNIFIINSDISIYGN